jgi:aspartyl-tRNA synthetase
VDKAAVPAITYAESMLKYGSDKPDLRNPLIIADVTEVFKRGMSSSGLQGNRRDQGGVVRVFRRRALSTSRAASSTSSMTGRKRKGAGSWLYRVRAAEGGKGPIAKFLPEPPEPQLNEGSPAPKAGDALFFVCDKEAAAAKLRGCPRRIGNELGLIDRNEFHFCWIVDFPMYEFNEDTKKIDFSHNPFSMPQGDHEGAAGRQGPAHHGVPVRHRVQWH